MKKKDYNLLKVIGIAFLLFVVLTWIIPVGSFSGGSFVKGDITPVGLYGIFTSIVYSFAVFAQYFVLILCVGGFYGVLNKTSVYQKIIDFFDSKSKKGFLIATVIIFGLIASVFGEIMMLFVLLPFFMTILLKLGYDKLSSVAATVGAYLVGTVASISGNMAIYKSYFNLQPKSFVIFNIIMFIVMEFLLCMYIISKNKNNCKSENISSKEILLYDECKGSSKNVIPMIIILSLVVLLLVLGLYNWYYSFNVSFFTELHSKLMDIKLFGTDIVGKIFGSLSEIGYLSNYDISAVLLVASVVIAWIYSIKFDEFVDSFKKGAKEMLLPGIYVILASTIFATIVTGNGANISLTISNSILGLSEKFNLATGMLSGILGSFFYNDYLYLMNGIYGIVSLYDANMMPAILFVFQSMFGLMMFILPISITLICGLKYLEVSYKDWMKYIWKFLIQLFLICLIGSIIFLMIV